MLSQEVIEALHTLFDPCTLCIDDDAIGVMFETPDAYEMWLTMTAIRNHMDVLEKIQRDPCPEDACREWLRYGYVIIAEKRGESRCIQIEVYPQKKM
jgi:hypothetical protein